MYIICIYIITFADHHVFRTGTPPETACSHGAGDGCLYHEKMVLLPNSYQMNDHKQAHYHILETGRFLVSYSS